MLTAKILRNNVVINVKIETAENKRALIRTLDGSKPFVHETARTDPELPEPPRATDWDWVSPDELYSVAQDGMLLATNKRLIIGEHLAMSLDVYYHARQGERVENGIIMGLVYPGRVAVAKDTGGYVICNEDIK